MVSSTGKIISNDEFIGKSLESELGARHAFIPTDHPVSKFARERFRKVGNGKSKDIEVLVDTNWRDVNAYALSNNRIVLTSGLLNFIGSVEELDAVLSHEKRHIAEGHFEEKRKRRKKIREYVAASRLAEYRADFGIFFDDYEEKNPYGQILLMRRFAEQKGWDVTHGRSVDRLINVLLGTHLVDFGDIETVTTPLPKEARLFTAQEERKNSLLDIVTSEDRKLISKRLESAGRADFHQAIYGIVDIIPRRERNIASASKLRNKDSEFAVRAREDGAVINVLEDRLRVSLQDFGYNVRESSLLTNLVRWTVIGKDSSDAGDEIRTEKDLELFYLLANRETFYKLGIFADEEYALKLLDNLVPELISNLFSEFDVDKYVAFSINLAQRFGGIVADDDFRNDVLRKSFVSGLLGLDSKDERSKRLVDGFSSHLDEREIKLAIKELPKSYRGLFNGGSEADSDTVSSEFASLLDPFIEREKSKIKNKKPDSIEEKLDRSRRGEKQKDEEVDERKEDDPKVDVIIDELRAKFGDPNEFGRQVYLYTQKVSQVDIPEFRGLQSWQTRSLFNPILETINSYFGKGAIDLKEFLRVKELVFITSNGKSEKPAIDSIVTEQEYVEIQKRHGSSANFLRDLKNYIESSLSDRLSKYDFITEENGYSTNELYEITNFSLLRQNLLRKDLERVESIESITEILEAYAVLVGDKRYMALISTNEEILTVMNNNVFDLSNSQHARALYAISCHIPDTAISIGLQERALEVILATSSFDEGFEFLNSEISKENTRSTAPIREFIDKKAVKLSQLRRLKQKISDLLNFNGDSDLDKLVMAEAISNLLTTRRQAKFLEVMLDTGENDAELRRMIISACVGKNISVEDVDATVQNLYHTNALQKHALVRQLLCSDEGLLMRSKGREELDNSLLSKILKEPESDDDMSWHGSIKTVTSQFLINAPFEDVYFVLAPILAERILRAPLNQMGTREALVGLYLTYNKEHGKYRGFSDVEHWEDLVKKYLTRKIKRTEILDKIERTYLVDYETRVKDAMRQKKTADVIKLLEEQQHEDPSKNKDFYYGIAQPMSRFETILSECGATPDDKAIEDLVKEMEELYANHRSARIKKARSFLRHLKSDYENFEYERVSKDLSFFSGTDIKPKISLKFATAVDSIIKREHKETRKLGVLEFILEAAKNLGSPGVRFLQLFGQYVDIPEQYEKEFSQVYDGIKGQSKISAFMLLEREWKTLEDEVEEIRASVGGGSLMTVYEVLNKNGRREVVKVLNPNASFHTENSFKVIRETIESLSEHDDAYEIALPMIDDIKDWIQADISFDGFLEKDKEFRKTNDGYKLRFRGNPYKIKVPESFGEENKYYKREEFIDGTNLTQMDELESQGHDLKAIVSLIANNYIAQIKNGRVHSDVHPGNFRVTSDRKVAILDRNYFIELDKDDNKLLYGVATAKDHRKKADAVITYLRSQGQEIHEECVDGLYETLEGSGDGIVDLSKAIRYVRSQGIIFPLKHSLIVKNFMALDSMAKRAGFSGLKPALDYAA